MIFLSFISAEISCPKCRILLDEIKSDYASDFEPWILELSFPLNKLKPLYFLHNDTIGSVSYSLEHMEYFEFLLKLQQGIIDLKLLKTIDLEILKTLSHNLRDLNLDDFPSGMVNSLPDEDIEIKDFKHLSRLIVPLW